MGTHFRISQFYNKRKHLKSILLLIIMNIDEIYNMLDNGWMYTEIRGTSTKIKDDFKKLFTSFFSDEEIKKVLPDYFFIKKSDNLLEILNMWAIDLTMYDLSIGLSLTRGKNYLVIDNFSLEMSNSESKKHDNLLKISKDIYEMINEKKADKKLSFLMGFPEK